MSGKGVPSRGGGVDTNSRRAVLRRTQRIVRWDIFGPLNVLANDSGERRQGERRVEVSSRRRGRRAPRNGASCGFGKLGNKLLPFMVIDESTSRNGSFACVASLSSPV